MCGCYTCVLVAQWGSILRFGMMRMALVPRHLCVVRIRVLVLVGTPSEVAHGPIIEYTPTDMEWGSSSLAPFYLDVVSLVEWR